MQALLVRWIAVRSGKLGEMSEGALELDELVTIEWPFKIFSTDDIFCGDVEDVCDLIRSESGARVSCGARCDIGTQCGWGFEAKIHEPSVTYSFTS